MQSVLYGVGLDFSDPSRIAVSEMRLDAGSGEWREEVHYLSASYSVQQTSSAKRDSLTLDEDSWDSMG
jgi:hypothetical protein